MGKDIDFSRGGIKRLTGRAKGLARDTFLRSYQTCGRCCIFSGHSIQLWTVHVFPRDPEHFHNRETHAASEARVWLLLFASPLSTSTPSFLGPSSQLQSSICHQVPLKENAKKNVPVSLSMQRLRSPTARRWQMPEDTAGIPFLGKKQPAYI